MEQKRPIAVARAMEIRLMCQSSCRSNMSLNRLSPFRSFRRAGVGRNFLSDRLGIVTAEFFYTELCALISPLKVCCFPTLRGLDSIFQIYDKYGGDRLDPPSSSE